LLTSDLVRVRQRGELVVPRWLDEADRRRLRPVAAALIGAATSSVGLSLEELEAAWERIAVPARDRVAAAGDRVELEGGDELAAQSLRAELFGAAAAARRALGPGEAFDRAAVVGAVAAARGVEPPALEAALFADLKGRERVVAFAPIAPETLLAAYDLALAQAVLLRAARVRIEISGEGPERLRRLFRAARFHGLLHSVWADGDAIRVELDGPMSLFDAVQRYGLRLACFLPHVLRCRAFRLEADLIWGPRREPRRLVLESAGGLRAPDDGAIPDVRPEVASLLEAFEALGSPWRGRVCDRLIAIPGEPVVAPDAVFEDLRTGEEVHLEVFGFWSRAAVFARVEQIRRGATGRMILAVGKHLRVSEELLGEDDAGEIHVFKSAISARAILERLERGARASEARVLP
jgi:predicted nuclease of restriction endonuclease-like RecB superfamily